MLGAWNSLWALLAVLHVTQGIWLSGGAAYPGGLGDGRFNQLILEHGYQSLRGVYEWSSPSQFYPTSDTLGYSDTHAGTLPIYAMLRFAGYSMDHAWQFWFVVVATLNTFAAFRLFAALAVDRRLRGPLVFAAVASVTMVWFAGTHMQMLPCFPMLLAWAELVQWSRDRTPARLLAASGWIAWQFAAGPYLAFFGVVFIAAIGALRFLAARAGTTPAAQAPPPVKSSWPIPSIVATVGVSLAAAVALIYAHAVKGGAGRSMEEIRDLAPHFRSWFTASPVHLFYPEGWPGRMANHVEHAWLAGFLPWLLLLPALAIGWSLRRTVTGAWLLATSAGALAVALFFTQWGEPGVGAWLFVAEKIESLRAFRSSGRIAGLLQVVQVAAAGLLFTHWLTRGQRTRWLVAGLTALLVIEGLGARQPTTELAVAAKRAHALIAAWRAAGDKPVLAYAFGYTNQSEVDLHLDAWSAALRLQRATINGYSGGLPGSHHRFLWNSTAANARDLLATLGVPAENVSIVEQLSPTDEAVLGIQRFDGRPVEHLDAFDLQPFAWKLYAYLERYEIENVPMYQFTPAAELRFHLPASASAIEYLVAFRPDAYTLGGKTDGCGVTWSIQVAGEAEQVVFSELLTPLTRPEHRGVLARNFELPASQGRERVLILRTDTGPAHDLPWDFLLFGRLRVK